MLLTAALIDPGTLPARRSLNLALLGLLGAGSLDIDPLCWQQAIRKHLKPELQEVNLRAFELGRGLSHLPRPHWNGVPARVEPAGSRAETQSRRGDC